MSGVCNIQINPQNIISHVTSLLLSNNASAQSDQHLCYLFSGKYNIKTSYINISTFYVVSLSIAK